LQVTHAARKLNAERFFNCPGVLWYTNFQPCNETLQEFATLFPVSSTDRDKATLATLVDEYVYGRTI